jgi:hypothetical protein
MKYCIIEVIFANDGDDSNFSKLFVIDLILEKELFESTKGMDWKEKNKRQKQILEEKGIIKVDYDRSEIFSRVEKPVLHPIVYHVDEFEEMYDKFKNITNFLT